MKVKLNPDTKLVNKIREAIKQNGGYCPCQIEKTMDTLCMCKSFLEAKEIGQCHCLLYYKEKV